jgi:uncharacterized MAPEG superfamily protein
MTATMTPELKSLATITLITALMWLPYTVQLIRQQGALAAFWDPFHETPIEAKWAQRAKRAHANAIENLAVFAPLVLVLHVTSAGTALTAAAATTFVLVRAAHFLVYTLAVPLVRTLLFLVGFGCQLVLAATLLGWLR